MTVIARVPAGSVYVVERFGRFLRTLSPGIHLLLPLVDRVAFRYSTEPRETALTDTCITYDNIAVQIASTIRWQIADAGKAAYAAANLDEFVAGIVRTAQRNWIANERWSDARETTRSLQVAVLRAVAKPAAEAGVKVLEINVKPLSRR